jgi:hypothetical protein
MGCAIFFVAMINHPELNNNIEVMMALAPATALDHMRSPIRYFAPFVTALQVCTVIIISICTQCILRLIYRYVLLSPFVFMTDIPEAIADARVFDSG